MTKIIYTLGSSSDNEKSISDMVSNGMHVVRLNFSHAGGNYSYVESIRNLVRQAPRIYDELVAGAVTDIPKNLCEVLVDTKGPEIRT